MDVRTYQTLAGRNPYVEWVRGLKDRQGVSVIRNRIKRLRMGQIGDHRTLGNGIWELRIFYGPGYRVYYLRDGEQVVILLCGGDKDSQFRDMAKAKLYAADYWRRK